MRWANDTEPLRRAVSPAELHELLQRVELAGQYQRAARARQLGMHQVELEALEHLVVCDGLTPGELGHRLGLTSGGVTALAGRLIDAGHVTRSLHPYDRRMRILTATEEGRTRVGAYLEPVLASTNEALSWLSREGSQQLARLLELLAVVKEDAAADTPAPPSEHADNSFRRTLVM